MSQSGDSSSTTTGSPFVSPDGPWASFLEHLADHGNIRAENLLKEYQSDLWDVTRAPIPDLDGEGNELLNMPFAQIVDIDSDNTVRTWSTISFRQLHDLSQQRKEVSRFLSDLNSCEAEASSRLLIFGSHEFDLYKALGSDGGMPAKSFVTNERIYAAEEDLLISHILGIEYDTDFSFVFRKLRQTGTCYGHSSRFQGLGYTYEDMIFYSPDTDRDDDISGTGRQLFRAYTLGPRRIKDRPVYCSELFQ